MPNFSQAFIAFMGSYTYPGNPYIWWGIRGSYGNLYGYHHEPLQKMCCNGIVLEDDFPFEPDSVTGLEEDTIFTSWGADRYRFTSWDSVGRSVTEIKTALIKGPLSTGIVYSDWEHLYYDGGILKGNSDSLGNHMVTIVGWNYNELEEDCEYWIVKNSFGPEWPNGTGNGYMRISSYGSHAVNYFIKRLELLPVSYEGNDLAYNYQTILDLPIGAGEIYHRPDPYTLFNGWSSADQWEWGGTAHLSPKSDTLGNPIPPIDLDTFAYYDEKKVWAGKPVAPYVTGPTEAGCFVPIWYYAWANSPSGLMTAESFSWELPSGLNLLNTYSNPARIRVEVNSPGNHLIKCFATNDLGTDSTYYYVYCPVCYTLAFNAFPNPSSTELTVEIEGNGNIEPDFEIDLIDAVNKKWKTKKTKNKTTTFLVGDVPNGTYILKVSVFHDGQKVKEKSITIMIIK